MDWYVSGALLIALVVLAMATSLPVAFAFLLANVIGVLLFIGGLAGLEQLVANASTAITSFTLITIPLFILMGELFFHTGVSARVFGAIDKLFGGVPARLSYMTVTEGTLFATLSGSSMANTALLGSSLLPEMTRHGYKDHLSMGPIVACGALAIIIPPSGLAVLLGSLAHLDIGELLIAGLIPGFLLAGLYLAVIWISVRLNPSAAPGYPVGRIGWGATIRLVSVNVLPMLLVLVLVVGVILLGLATPTESAAFGVMGVTLIAAMFRSLTRESLIRAIVSSAKVSGMVFMIILGSSTFSQLLAFSGATPGLIGWATGLEVPPLVLLLAILAVLLVLGLFMEAASIMMLTVPIFFPLIVSLGYDPIWFGVVMLVSLEIGLVTPPFGMGLFVMLGVAPKGTTLGQVSRSVLPYLGCMLALVALLIAWPGIATALR
ncbi:TRAP transporter large permease [Paracoccus sp. 11-3]|uniref:TRAP transporter large permease protein n=1 Tax=Paracoccus amoyensis TaxID=2760093 RepID=A0A926GFT2_9RHOB|nr:TRAP transporter large permease [Paracoccus amoyensis]MBC9247487.1 TRAP transporter large permease [Paracoccus amoyensis]